MSNPTQFFRPPGLRIYRVRHGHSAYMFRAVIKSKGRRGAVARSRLMQLSPNGHFYQRAIGQWLHGSLAELPS
jgi:hypothetical protein